MAKRYTPYIVTWLKRRKLRVTRLVLQEDGRPVLYYEPEPPKGKDEKCQLR